MTTKLLPSYDPTLFQGAISYYLQYRPRYPNALYDLISQEFQLDGQGKLLDLGCGIGLVAIALHDRFQSVLGIDPDTKMLEVAKQEAKLAHASNIAWVRDLAENISPAIGTFSLVTIGRAFHWMDQELVLQRSYDLLDRPSNANKGIAIIQTEKDIWSNDSVWAQNVLATIKRWLGEERRVGSISVPLLYKSDLEVLDRSPFVRIKRHKIDFQKHWTIDNFIGYLYSTAYCRRDYFNGDTSVFEAEIKAAILSAEPSGQFVEDVPISVYLGFKD